MQKMLDSTGGLAALVDILHPIINAAVIQRISQPFYAEADSLNFAKSESIALSTKTSPKTTSASHLKSTSSKVIEDLPAGLPLENINLPTAVIERHPLLPLLFDTAYVQRVVLTVRERLHMVGDIAILSIPFFVEPSFVTEDALEMRKKFWNPDVYTQMKDLYSIPIYLC
jgi:hypothetical protein